MVARRLAGIGMVMVLVGMPAVARAMHPLITDDAETQGRGKFQLEVNGSYASDRETVGGLTIKNTQGEAVTALTYGANETLDVFIEAPHAGYRIKEDGIVVSSEKGLSDVTVGAKWRFFKKDGLSFAVKPAVSLPSGDEKKGLGAGKTGYSAFFITAREIEPVGVFLNLGVIRNAGAFEEEKDLWHASIACAYEAVERLKLAANIGMEKDPDKNAGKDPAFGLLGVIYELNEGLDLDLGVKKALNDAEADLAVLAGVTLRF